MALLATYRCAPVPSSFGLLQCICVPIGMLIRTDPALPSEAAVAGTERRGRGFGTGANARSPESMSDARTQSFPAGAASGACGVARGRIRHDYCRVHRGPFAGETTSLDKTVRTNQPAMKAAKATAMPNPMIKGRDIPKGRSCPRPLVIPKPLIA
jgi:hypothetical protein